MILLPRLYAVADAAFGNPVTLAQSLFDGGARLVQIRNKHAGSSELLEQVEATLKIAPPDARVIVNDRVDVAVLTKAGGVHLGQDDLDLEQARKVTGLNSVVGLSTHNMEQALRGDRTSADYLAVGPIFATTTKPDASPVVGLERLREICRAVEKPVVAIGGITLATAPDVLKAGVSAVAVISGLLSANDISTETRRWVSSL